MVYTVFRGKVIELSLGADGLYRDQDGTVFALRDDSASFDLIDECGVAPFTIKADEIVNDACKNHDWKYSSPAYQRYHTRNEADQGLRDAIAADKSLWRFVAWPFFFISRMLGSDLWEDKKTDV